MKLTILLLLTTLLSYGQYQKGNNLITIGHNSPDVLKELKLILTDNDYSIRTIDTDIGLIETDYKDCKRANTRLVIRYNDSTVVFKGFATNGMSVSSFGGGLGFNSGTAEFRNEFRPLKSSVMAQGFDEMERVAAALYVKYQSAFIVSTE